MRSISSSSLLRLRKSVRRYIARPALQQTFRVLYRIALAGMNYGGAGSSLSAGDETALQRVRRMRAHMPGPPVIFDVGANVGSYVGQILRIVGADAKVYAFEPSREAFAKLQQGYGKLPNVQLMPVGIGATGSTATLWSAVPGSVLASTYVNPINGDVQGEPIQLVSLDEFCAEHAIEHIALLKLDVEGGELDALRGAARLLERDAIALIQFEFGQPSIGARTFFADLYGLLAPRFDIYRVLPSGVEHIAAYHETLEVFMSTNYLAVSRNTAARTVVPR